jgi:Transglutaminase-like superfamily
LKLISKFLALPLADKWLLFKVVFALLFLKISLVILPFQVFKKLYNSLLLSGKNTNLNEKQIEKLVYFIKASAANLPFGLTCLPQALTLKYYLKKDPNVQLIIGINTEITFKAHAWVEKNKIYLIGDIPFETYTPLWTWS